MKTKIIIITLDEFGEETEEIIKECDTKEEAEDFVSEHEQDFADNSEIYAIYIE